MTTRQWLLAAAVVLPLPAVRPAAAAADRRHVPLRTILVTAGVAIATYLAGKLMYPLRDVVLLMLVAGFVAMLLNPVVASWYSSPCWSAPRPAP